ncbi:Protein CBG26941 [Caenorhabditis briggsae]|uniref:Protein CBG26941 n=2 Tax=Caenorhabditis briggsae TaxID=6238 RepID=B6IHT4_CAEBR|nr:Protein CBG26941 [Caenorhabditis briggsae]CAR99464.1 Protein CBG26941 [Caenorhabditis briggsae]
MLPALDSLDPCTIMLLISVPIFVVVLFFFVCQYRKNILYIEKCAVYTNRGARFSEDFAIPQIIISPGRRQPEFHDSARASPIPFLKDVTPIDASRLSPPPFQRT